MDATEKDVILICNKLMRHTFAPFLTLDCVTLFFHCQNVKITLNFFVTVKTYGGILSHDSLADQWEAVYVL